MAITVSYSFEDGPAFSIPGNNGHPTLHDLDLVARHDGGIAVVGSRGGVTNLTIYDGLLGSPPVHGDLSYAGTMSAVAEGTDGYFFMVSLDPTSATYSIVGPDGATAISVVAASAGENQTFSAADVTVASATMVVAIQVDSTSEGSYILLDFRVEGSNDAIIDVSEQDDTAPSICTLADGAVAVAWTTDNGGGQTQTWTAVYEANGDERSGPTNLDTVGDVNRGVSAVALDDGGFAVVYEDDQAEVGKNHIIYAHLDADNALAGVGYVDVTPSENATASQASATVLSNGFVAISYTLDYGGGDEDIRVRVVDTSNDTVLDTFGDVETDLHNSHDSSIAAWRIGGLVSAWEDDTDGSQAQALQLVSTRTGDGHRNIIVGSSLIDVMSGLGGKDWLVGYDNADRLFGGSGDDLLTPGSDEDIAGIGGDSVNGGGGIDTVDYRDAGPGLIVDLASSGANAGDATGDTYSSVENILGSAFADVLRGDGHDNTLTDSLGRDDLAGRGGSDLLNGGAGDDIFRFFGASDSTGIDHDSIKDVALNGDRFAVPGHVKHIDGAIHHGTLSRNNFDASLADAVDSAHLGKHHAVLFTPDNGTFDGDTFLIVDVNNVAGYQAGEDLVVAFTGTMTGSLSVHDFI